MKLTGKIAQEDIRNLDKPQLSARHKKIPRTWVIVTDDRAAKIFRKKDGRLDLLGEAIMTDAHPLPANRTVGRVSSTGSNAIRHKYEPHMDVRRQQENSFTSQLADWLDTAVQQDAFDRLVLAAPPRMLGDLRKTLSSQVCRHIVAELNKELTKHSEPALRQELANVLII